MKFGRTFIRFWNILMSFDWLQYLNLAKELAGQATIPAEQEARLRDAISLSLIHI
jgi:hypothetical protein